MHRSRSIDEMTKLDHKPKMPHFNIAASRDMSDNRVISVRVILLHYQLLSSIRCVELSIYDTGTSL